MKCQPNFKSSRQNGENMRQ